MSLKYESFNTNAVYSIVLRGFDSRQNVSLFDGLVTVMSEFVSLIGDLYL